MQTFLPYADFEASARALDYKRLGKQRVETWQIIRALRGETRGWRTHPAALMWTGYEEALAYYGLVMCREWVRRGYNDTMTERFEELLEGADKNNLDMPHWIGDPDFHRSHQSNLIRKDPIFYGSMFDGVPADLEYLWPPVRTKSDYALA